MLGGEKNWNWTQVKNAVHCIDRILTIDISIARRKYMFGNETIILIGGGLSNDEMTTYRFQQTSFLRKLKERMETVEWLEETKCT